MTFPLVAIMRCTDKAFEMSGFDVYFGQNLDLGASRQQKRIMEEVGNSMSWQYYREVNIQASRKGWTYKFVVEQNLSSDGERIVLRT